MKLKIDNLLKIVLLLGVTFIVCSCRQGRCSKSEQASGLCENSYKDLLSAQSTPKPIQAVEYEPNGFFSQANNLIQTQNADGSMNYQDNANSVIGTIDNAVDEDWYKIEITAKDFDRLNRDNSGCLTQDLQAYKKCYSSKNGYPKPSPNSVPDYKELSFYDTNTANNPPDNSDYVNRTFMKPRFIVSIDSPTLEALAVRVEIYSPGLGIDQNGALSKKSIADSYQHVPKEMNYLNTNSTSDTNYITGTLRCLSSSGKLAISSTSSTGNCTPGTNALKLVFPIRWEHNVRINGEDPNNTFFHSCYVDRPTINPTGLSQKKLIGYQDLVKRDLNKFRSQDPYNIGTYYIRVSSNGTYSGKKYRIKWYWNTGDALDGGVSQWTPSSSASTSDYENFAVQYNQDKVQISGGTGEANIASACDRSVDLNLSWTENSTKPLCKQDTGPVPDGLINCINGLGGTTTANVSIANGGTGLFCYNLHSLQNPSAGYTPTDDYDICLGDENKDGLLSSKFEDIGCFFDTSLCSDPSVGGIVGYYYNKSQRACDCWRACSSETTKKPLGCNP